MLLLIGVPVAARHAVAGVKLVEIAAFHVEVERPLAAAGLDAGDAIHFRGRFEVLEILKLINEYMIHAKLVKRQAVVFLILGHAGLSASPRWRLSAFPGS